MRYGCRIHGDKMLHEQGGASYSERVDFYKGDDGLETARLDATAWHRSDPIRIVCMAPIGGEHGVPAGKCRTTVADWEAVESFWRLTPNGVLLNEGVE